MIVIAFALFSVLILAWLAAPDGRVRAVKSHKEFNVASRGVGDGTVQSAGAD